MWATQTLSQLLNCSVKTVVFSTSAEPNSIPIQNTACANGCGCVIPVQLIHTAGGRLGLAPRPSQAYPWPCCKCTRWVCLGSEGPVVFAKKEKKVHRAWCGVGAPHVFALLMLKLTYALSFTKSMSLPIFRYCHFPLCPYHWWAPGVALTAPYLAARLHLTGALGSKVSVQLALDAKSVCH